MITPKAFYAVSLPSSPRDRLAMTDLTQAQGCFKKAIDVSSQAEAAFREVAQLLLQAKKFGPKHDLTKEWDRLRRVRSLS